MWVPLLEPPEISIHALREEGDELDCQKVLGVRISIHALREEGDIGCPAFRPDA